MDPYYAKKLAGDRLRLCYAIAPTRVQQYLQAEIAFVRRRLRPTDTVLELGCGYGRVLQHLADRAQVIVGIDTSAESLALARHLLADKPSCRVVEMDAGAMTFDDGRFDVTVCIQNGISAFGIDPLTLMREAIRVTRSGGIVLFSSYAERFWDDRLRWFRLQATHGLVGPIDEEATGEGVIVCRDGFRARTITEEEFNSLTAACGVTATISEVDGSSVFCEIIAW
jgi:SAM-dependent methyltransferase